MAKGTKSQEIPSESVTFTLPDQPADTRLEILGVEFYVHSTILKFGSGYFRKSLDPADKAACLANPEFHYDYSTVVDNDGKTWSLVAASKVNSRNKGPQIPKAATLGDLDGMRLMLKALYNEPFVLSNLPALQTLARLADFYAALPSISKVLDGALLRSPSLIAEIPQTPLEFLTIARTLRNTVLYKESMIHVASQWNSLQAKLQGQPEFLKLAAIAYSSLCGKLETAQMSILKVIARTKAQIPPSGSDVVIADRVQYHTARWATKQFGTLAPYYRELYEDKYEITKAHDKPGYGPASYANWSARAIQEMQSILHPVLENNLILERSRENVGQGKFEDRFLCAEVREADIPWDRTETDW